MESKEKQTILTVLKDAYVGDNMALFSSYIFTRYKLCFENLSITYDKKEQMIKEIIEVDKEMEEITFDLSELEKYTVLESNENLIIMDSYDSKSKTIVHVKFCFQNYKKSKVIFDIIQKYQTIEDNNYVIINSLYLEQNGALTSSVIKKKEKDFSKNDRDYYPYLDVEEMFNQYSMSDSNILILCGAPGVGKTRLGDDFINYMMDNKEEFENAKDIEITTHGTLEEWDEELEEESEYPVKNGYTGDKATIMYVKNEEILSLDKFWNDLKVKPADLVFLDDLDYSLLPRTQDVGSSEDIKKDRFISNFLSFTDGIFEQGSSTKFIITTNRPLSDIDTAILRKGRTFDILELRALKEEEAKVIWLKHGLDERDFDEEMFGDEILQADLGNSISMKLKAKAKNVELSPYILEEGISLYASTKNKKHIGL